MATVCDSVSIIGLRKTHFEQLLSYLDERDRSRWYYGSKKHFETRHDELREWLTNVIDTVSQDGTIIPKN